MAVELLRQLASQRSGFAAAGPSDSSLRSEFKSKPFTRLLQGR
jgi:hypothetical protein